jgi:metal-sulfur cluster biosynthetic enzyme
MDEDLSDTRTMTKEQDVWDALSTVTDPEIDESVTTLEFVTQVDVDVADRVQIVFRLPTYWCAPNFAFLMASDMRDAVEALEWVREVRVELLDHFSAPLINRSVTLKQNFREAFPGETDGDLKEIRKKFLGVSFERRQELLMRHLLEHGITRDRLVNATISQLKALKLSSEGSALRNLYLFSWRRLYQVLEEDALAFVSKEGKALATENVNEYLRLIAGVRRTADFNGLICRGLLESRKEQLAAQAAGA